MANQGIYDLVDTWGDGATTFTAIKMNVTDTASAAGSLLLDLQTGGVSRAQISKAGAVRGTGSNTAPAFSFPTETSTGIYLSSSRLLGLSVNSAAVIGWTDNGGNAQRLAGNLEFTTNIGNGGDVVVLRDAANTLALRNGVNAQTFRVYNTFTDASNYERGFVRWNTNSFEIGTEKLGTGSARNLFLTTDGTARWQVGNSTGHLFAVADNTYDIGASGATRPRNGYFGSDLVAGGNIYVGTAGVLAFGNTRAIIKAGGADGIIQLLDSNQTSFNRIQFGGTTNAYPSLKRNGTVLQVRLADDSSSADFTAAQITANASTAMPAGGAVTAGVKMSTTANFGVFFGSGAPTLSAAKGSLYLRSDGTTTNDRMYVNTDGATTWTAVTTAA